jgi:hypothetical protein
LLTSTPSGCAVNSHFKLTGSSLPAGGAAKETAATNAIRRTLRQCFLLEHMIEDECFALRLAPGFMPLQSIPLMQFKPVFTLKKYTTKMEEAASN